MKITLSEDTNEVLRIFTRDGMHVIIRRQCQKCKKWVKLTALEVRRVKK